jgi:hypothetical protein
MYLHWQDREVESVLNALFEQAFNVAAFLCPLDDGSDFLCWCVTADGKVHIYRFDETFLIGPS